MTDKDKTNPLSAEHKRLARSSIRVPWTVLLVILVFFLGLGSGWLIWGRGTAEAAAANVAQPQPQAQQQQPTTAGQAAQGELQVPESVTRYDVPVDDDYIHGPQDAPITIVEFSDYECPFCQRWYQEVWLRLKEEYPTQVRLVYRDFPLPNHPNAISAAEAANCAGEQGKYFEYHDLLFGGSLGLNPEAYLSYAKEAGLNQSDFRTCIEERRYQAEVEADAKWASELGVSSTPTFFINGIPLIGAQPYEVFKQVIDLELAGKIPTE
jgi:protein-disulfide isomerase